MSGFHVTAPAIRASFEAAIANPRKLADLFLRKSLRSTSDFQLWPAKPAAAICPPVVGLRRLKVQWLLVVVQWGIRMASPKTQPV